MNECLLKLETKLDSMLGADSTPDNVDVSFSVGADTWSIHIAQSHGNLLKNSHIVSSDSPVFEQLLEGQTFTRYVGGMNPWEEMHYKINTSWFIDSLQTLNHVTNHISKTYRYEQEIYRTRMQDNIHDLLKSPELQDNKLTLYFVAVYQYPSDNELGWIAQYEIYRANICIHR
jgi:hypothetical protein